MYYDTLCTRNKPELIQKLLVISCSFHVKMPEELSTVADDYLEDFLEELLINKQVEVERVRTNHVSINETNTS